MNNILELINTTLQGEVSKGLSKSLGIKDESLQGAVTASLPFLLGGLAKNSKSKDGLQGLLGALEKDHDGGILKDKKHILSEAEKQQGKKIVGHILGEKKNAAIESVAKETGLNPKQSQDLLARIAPIVMGALGQTKQSSSGVEQLINQLFDANQKATDQAPRENKLLAMFFDKNGDGAISDDFLRMGIDRIKKKFLW